MARSGAGDAADGGATVVGARGAGEGPRSPPVLREPAHKVAKEVGNACQWEELVEGLQPPRSLRSPGRQPTTVGLSCFVPNGIVRGANLCTCPSLIIGSEEV